IKIRLLKKPRGPEPDVDPSLSNVGGVETPVRALNSVQVPGVAGRNLVIPYLEEKMLHHGQHVGMKQTAPISVRPVPSNHLKHEEPSSRFNKTKVLPVLSQSRQNDVKLDQFSRQ
ncbi:hypothetical protein Tco_0298188, partial [Tanacetum coccineum]